MNRLRLYDCRISRLPSDLGICQSDITRVADAVNTAQRRLLYAPEASDEGWWGTWAEMAFNLTSTQPCVTMPREIARLEAITVCDEPVPIQNQFYEYLDFGNGRMPKQFLQRCTTPLLQMYSRNNSPVFTDLSNAPQYMTVYPTSSDDFGKRVFISGTDNNDKVIYSIDNGVTVRGVFLTIASPSSTTSVLFKTITGVQKDVTTEPIELHQTDPTTGDEVLLLTMEPGEQVASYRRYLLDPAPVTCCTYPVTEAQPIQVTAIAKLDLIPVRVDTDYCLIQNLEAIIEEAQSWRYSTIDTVAAKQMAQEKHRQAIRLLNGELTHFLGVQKPAINFAPFGSARLVNQRIGTMI